MKNTNNSQNKVEDAPINPIEEFLCPECKEISTFCFSTRVKQLEYGQLVFIDGKPTMIADNCREEEDSQIQCDNCQSETSLHTLLKQIKHNC